MHTNVVHMTRGSRSCRRKKGSAASRQRGRWDSGVEEKLFRCIDQVWSVNGNHSTPRKHRRQRAMFMQMVRLCRERIENWNAQLRGIPNIHRLGYKQPDFKMLLWCINVCKTYISLLYRFLHWNIQALSFSSCLVYALGHGAEYLCVSGTRVKTTRTCLRGHAPLWSSAPGRREGGARAAAHGGERRGPAFPSGHERCTWRRPNMRSRAFCHMNKRVSYLIGNAEGAVWAKK